MADSLELVIDTIMAREVLDSRGNPTVEAEVYTKNISSSAICPSGASTGTFEAFEKRDINNKRYLGKSVLTAVNLVNTKISKKLKGQSIHNQERIDTLLINLDGTRQKTNLGANAMLAVLIMTPRSSLSPSGGSSSIPAADSEAHLNVPIKFTLIVFINWSIGNVLIILSLFPTDAVFAAKLIPAQFIKICSCPKRSRDDLNDDKQLS